jgi:hypothetical protein
MKRLSFKDRIRNKFYVCRYKFYSKYRKTKLKDSSPSIKPGRTLVFEDDFDEVSWSRKSADTWRKWGIGEHWGSFHPRNGRSWWTEPVFNNDSTITLGTKYEPKTFYRKEEGGYWYSPPINFDPVEELTVPYSVGGLSTGHNDPDYNTLFKQQYGRWECRCKVPADKGIRSAYWTWGSTWPPEIDIFEIDGRSDHSDQKINLHFGKTSDNTKDSIGSTFGALRRDGEWQEFVLEWSPGKIEMITDGIKIFQCTTKDVIKWFDDPIAQMWVLVYQSVIGDIHHEPDEDGWYSKFIVDYVRVYK